MASQLEFEENDKRRIRNTPLITLLQEDKPMFQKALADCKKKVGGCKPRDTKFYESILGFIDEEIKHKKEAMGLPKKTGGKRKTRTTRKVSRKRRMTRRR